MTRLWTTETQEAQMNRALESMVLFLILTGISWQAGAFSECGSTKTKVSVEMP